MAQSDTRLDHGDRGQRRGVDFAKVTTFTRAIVTGPDTFGETVVNSGFGESARRSSPAAASRCISRDT